MTIFLKWCNSLRQRRKDEERTQNDALMTQEQGRSARREWESASFAWQRRKKKRTFLRQRGNVECNNTPASCTTTSFAFVPNRFSKSAKMMMWHKVRGGFVVGVAAAKPGWNSLQRVGHVNTISRRVGGRLRVEGNKQCNAINVGGILFGLCICSGDLDRSGRFNYHFLTLADPTLIMRTTFVVRNITSLYLLFTINFDILFHMFHFALKYLKTFFNV